MSLDLNDCKSTLVQVMACCQATSHYLSQSWPRFMSPCGIIRPPWVNLSFPRPRWHTLHESVLHYFIINTTECSALIDLHCSVNYLESACQKVILCKPLKPELKCFLFFIRVALYKCSHQVEPVQASLWFQYCLEFSTTPVPCHSHTSPLSQPQFRNSYRHHKPGCEFSVHWKYAILCMMILCMLLWWNFAFVMLPLNMQKCCQYFNAMKCLFLQSTLGSLT